MAEKMDFVENHSQDSDEDEQYSNENEHSLYSEEREDIDSDERGVSEISSHELTADMEEKRSGDEAIFEKHQSQDSYDNKHFFCNEESIDIDSDENDEIDVAEIPFYELRAGSGDKGCEDKADTEKCGDHDPTDLGRITNNFPQGDSAESENPPFKYYAAIDVVSPPKFVSQEDVSASSNVEIHAPAMTREIDKVKGSAKRKPKRKSQQNTDDLEAPRKSAIVSLIRRKENFSPSLTYTREKRSDVKQRHKHLRKANDKQAKSRKGRAIRVTVDSGKKARAGRNSKMNSDLVEESNNIKRTRSQWRIERRRSGRVRNKPQEGSYKVENTPKASDQSLVKHGRNKSQVRSYKRENKPTPLNQPLRKVGRPRKMSGGKGNKQRRIRFKIRKYDKIIEDSPGIKRHSTAVAAKTDDSDNNGDIEVDSGMETSPFSTTNSRPKLLRNEQSPPFELLYRYPVISSESNRREFRSTVASSAGAYSLQRNEMRNTKQETRINNENLESNVKGLLTADDDFSSDHTYVKVSKFSDQKSDHTSTLRGTKQKSSSTCSLKCVECSSIGKQATEILLKMKEHINRHKVKDSFHCEGCNVDFEDTLNFQNHVLLQVMTNSRSATEQVKSQKNVATKVTATLGNARNESRYQPLQAVEEIKSNFISDASESNEATSGQRETIRGNELNKDERRKLQPIEASNLTVSSEFLPELEVSKVQESGSNRKNRKRPQRPSSVETFTRKSTRRSSAQTNASSQSSIPSSLDASSVTGKNTGQHNVTSEKSLTKELPVVETEVVIGPVQIESSTVDADCPDVHNMTQSNVKNENASQSLKIVKIRTRASTKNLNSKSTKKASFTNQIDSNVHSAVGLQEKASPAKAGTETSSRKSNNKTPSNKKDNKNSTKELNNKTSAKNQDNKNSSRDSDKKTLAKKSNKTNPPSKKVDKNPPKKPDTKNSSKPKTITKPSTATENRIVCRCTICKMEFNSVDALSAHHKVEHAVISKFSCGFCDKKFFGATARNKHILEEHRKPLYARNCASSAQQLVTVLIPSINTAKSTSLENSNTDLSMKTSQTEAKDPPANEQGMPTEAVEALQSEAKKPPADTQGMTTEAQGSQALLQGNASTRLENGLAKITVAATSTSGPAVTTSKSALEIPPSKPALANFLQGKTYVMLPGSVKTSILQTSFPQVQLGSGVSLLKIPQAYVRETPGGPPRIALPSKIKPKNTHLTGVDKIGTSQLQCEFSKNEIQVKEAEGAVIAPQLSFEKRLKQMKKYGRAMERKYMCATCKKTFIYLTDFRTHTYIHPQKQPLVIASRDGEAARYELVDRFKCKQCDASFYFKSQLWHHRRLKHNDKNTSSWVCPVCDQKFDGAVTFKKHSEAVHGITHAFICPTCGKRLRTNIKLTEHSYKHLPPEKHPFYCKLCQKGIPTSGKYKDHMQMHANKREYTCKICNKSFNTATVLQCHRRTHSDKSSWHKCPDCDKSFLYKHRLDAHRITHNKDAGFRCDLCGKVFTRERALEKHKRFHITGSRHECFICEQHFKSAKEISDHLDKEHGCDKLVCQICQASFISKHALMSHMKAHVKRLKENQAKSADLLSSKAVEDAARPPDSSNSEQVENTVKSIDLSNSKEVENLVKSVDSSSSKEVKNDPKHSCNNPTDHSGTKEKEMQQSSNEKPTETSSTILESSGSVERILHCGAPSLDALIDQSIGSDGRNNEKSSQSLLFQNTISSKIAQSSANQDNNISEDNFSLSIEDLVPIEDRIQEL